MTTFFEVPVDALRESRESEAAIIGVDLEEQGAGGDEPSPTADSTVIHDSQ